MQGLGDHGVSSEHHFARMLMALSTRTSPPTSNLITSRATSSDSLSGQGPPESDALPFPTPPVDVSNLNMFHDMNAVESVYTNGVHDALTSPTSSSDSDSDFSVEYSDDFDSDSDADADILQVMAASRALGPLCNLDDSPRVSAHIAKDNTTRCSVQTESASCRNRGSFVGIIDRVRASEAVFIEQCVGCTAKCSDDMSTMSLEHIADGSSASSSSLASSIETNYEHEAVYANEGLSEQYTGLSCNFYYEQLAQVWEPTHNASGANAVPESSFSKSRNQCREVHEGSWCSEGSLLPRLVCSNPGALINLKNSQEMDWVADIPGMVQGAFEARHQGECNQTDSHAPLVECSEPCTPHSPLLRSFSQ